MIDPYIHQYGRRLYGLCLTLCANRDEADDLYQETWLRVLKNFEKYDTSQPFEPWLTRICVNIYRNTLRRFLRSPIQDKFTTVQEKEQRMEAIPACSAEDYTELHEAINGLPEKLRVVVILYYFEDMDINAVADILNIPLGTVKSRLFKARSKLKEVLADETDL